MNPQQLGNLFGMLLAIFFMVLLVVSIPEPYNEQELKRIKEAPKPENVDKILNDFTPIESEDLND